MIPLNLLIVDDHASSRKLLRAQLETEGHNVLEASDGVQALAMLEHAPVGAVISDILMPNMDGFRLCREIRLSGKFSALPFVLYTSTYDSTTDRQLANDVGADRYVVKPASTPTILDALREAIQKAGDRKPPPSPPPAEAYVLKQYSEVLVRKLEEKNADLQASQHRFSDLFDFAPDVLLLTDSKDIIVQASRQVEPMFGWRQKELVGQPMEVLLAPDLRTGHINLRERCLQSAVPGLGERGGSELFGLRKDGTLLPVDIRHGSLDTENGPLTIVSLRDVTERTRFEQRRTAEHEVAGILANSNSLRDAVPKILQVIGRCLELDLALQRTFDVYPGSHRGR